jgi:WD40 repeat protein
LRRERRFDFLCHAEKMDAEAESSDPRLESMWKVISLWRERSRWWLIGLLVLAGLHAVLGELGFVPWLQPRPRLILRGHTADVAHAKFAPDGGSLATYGMDDTIRLWDLKSGRELRRWARTEVDWERLTFLPDSRTLAVVNDAGKATLWDVKTGHQRAAGEEGAFSGVWLAASPDGQTAVTYDPERGRLQTWDVSTGQLQSVLADDLTNTYEAAFSPDGRTLITRGGELKLWDMSSGKLRATLPATEQSFNFSPDSRTQLVRGPAERLNAYDVDNGTLRLRLSRRGEGPIRFLFAPDSRTVVIHQVRPGRTVADEPPHDAGCVRIWDTLRAEQRWELPLSLDNSRILGFCPDSRSLIVATHGTGSACLEFWDVATGCRRRTVELKGCLDFSSRARVVWPVLDEDSASLGSDGRIVLVARPEPPSELPAFLSWFGVPWSSSCDQSSLVVGVWDAVSECRLGELRIKREACKFSPDGRFLAAFGIRSDSQRWCDSSTEGGAVPLSNDDCSVEIWDVPPRRSVPSYLAWAAVLVLVGIVVQMMITRTASTAGVSHRTT